MYENIVLKLPIYRMVHVTFFRIINFRKLKIKYFLIIFRHRSILLFYRVLNCIDPNGSKVKMTVKSSKRLYPLKKKKKNTRTIERVSLNNHYTTFA